MSIEKRSRTSGTSRELLTSPQCDNVYNALGGRPGAASGAIGGGGYQDIYTISDAEGLEKLRRIGLSPAWIMVAKEIGFAAFMRMWAALADHDCLDGRGRIVVPVFRTFLRFERNEFIRAMLAAGRTDPEIIAAVKRKFHETPSKRNLRRLQLSA